LTIFTTFHVVYWLTQDVPGVRQAYQIAERFNFLSKEIIYGDGNAENGHLINSLDMFVEGDFVSDISNLGATTFAGAVAGV
jgi:hypothetical protein